MSDTDNRSQKRKFLAGGKFYHVNKSKCIDARVHVNNNVDSLPTVDCAPVLKALNSISASSASAQSSFLPAPIPIYEKESDIFDLTVDDADTLRAGDYLHFRKSFADNMRTLQIRKIVKYTKVVEDTKRDESEGHATRYEVEWKVYFNSPPNDEQYVTTLWEKGRRFQKVGTMQYVPLFRYKFVHCIERNSWDITWEE